MVSFDDCENNPGALRFMCEAYRGDLSRLTKVEAAFKRVVDEGIRGLDLYILWNDCCGRDTDFAVEVMATRDIKEIKSHLVRKRGAGTPFTR